MFFKSTKNLNNDFTIAIGDIHGCYDKLVSLVGEVENEIKEFTTNKKQDLTKEHLETEKSENEVSNKIVFLGDYIDRGDGSDKVIDFLIKYQKKHNNCIFLRGNHEQVFLDFLKDPESNQNWLSFGGYETLLSYGIDSVRMLNLGGNISDIRDLALKSIPKEHIKMIENTKLFVQNTDYFFVHAGIDPNKSLKNQEAHDYLWSRDKFINSKKKTSKVIVHGHTPHREPYKDKRRICVDTGVYLENGTLSAFAVLGDETKFISV